MKTSVKPVLRYPGSKQRIAKWITSYMPPHIHYLEPFFGSGTVFFAKPISQIETLNDINGQVVNLFKVIRDMPAELARAIEYTPWAREEYESIITPATEPECFMVTGDPLEDARRFMVRCWQAQGAKTSDKTGWSYDIQGNHNLNKSRRWKDIPETIIDAANRLKYAQIECRPAVEIVRACHYKTVLIYADPPYPLQVRPRRMYKNEMADTDHVELLEVLDEHPGPVILSGYACDLYDTRLKHWRRESRKAQAEKGQQREEVLWLKNVERGQASLFSGVTHLAAATETKIRQ